MNEKYLKRIEAQNKRIKVLEEEKKLNVYNLSDSILFNSYQNGIGSILSNMYPCLIYHKCNDGVYRYFNGVDHLYHFLMFENNPEIREKILKINGVKASFESKKIRQKNENLIPNEFKETKCNWNILYKCIREKARCSKDFYNALMSTIGKDLVELESWSTELEAGCVVRDNKAYGENYCGRAMMFLRDKLLKEKKELENNDKDSKVVNESETTPAS